MSLVPGGLQNLLEAIVEAVYGLCEDVAGHQRAVKYFPIVATIFLFVLFSNWLGLLPGVGTIGIWEEVTHGGRDRDRPGSAACVRPPPT